MREYNDDIKLTQAILKLNKLYNKHQSINFILGKAIICRYNNQFIPQFEEYNKKAIIHNAGVLGFDLSKCNSFDDIINVMTIENNNNLKELDKMIKEKIIDKSLEIIFNM